MHNAKAVCHIYSVVHKKSLRWKWSHLGSGGVVIDSREDYALISQCMQAARSEGYEPVAKWTGCALP